MIYFRRLLFVLLFATVFQTLAAQTPYPYAHLYKNLPFSMPEVWAPIFPANQVNLTDFGGKPDGITLNTEAFQKSINALAQKGGGTLIVSAGIWFTGPIVLQSNINLHLEDGAVILFSSDFNLYPLVHVSFEGLDTRRCQSPISGKNLTNVAITGEGSINGSGEFWRPLKKSKVTDAHWKQVVKSGGVVKDKNYWFPSKGALKGNDLSDMNVPRGLNTEADWIEIKDFLRPVMVSLVACKNVMLQGVLFENSPSWNIHPLMCENVIIDNVFVRNPGYAQNGDGVDLESCKNALIVNSTFDVGDDAICLKSGKDEDGRKRAMPTENVIVDNCKVFQGHGGFVVGSEMSGGVKNISLTKCQFMGTDVGLRFKSTRGRGGVVENIYVSDISMFNIATDSFLFDLFYGGKSASEALEDGDTTPTTVSVPKVSEETPAFRNIFVKNLISKNARRAMFFNGLPEMKITNINVENATISAQYGVVLTNAAGIHFKNVNIVPTEGPVITLDEVTDFNLAGFTYPKSSKEVVKVGKGTSNINLPVGTSVTN